MPRLRTAKEIPDDFLHAFDAQKHDRLGRAALSDLLGFYAALEEEINSLTASIDEGMPADSELFEKLVGIKKKYLNMIHGLRENNDDRERHALIIFADAVQDLMAFMHGARRH